VSSRRRRYRREPVAIADRLRRYRGGLDSPAGSELALLQGAWREIAGPQAAANSVVVRKSRAGVLTVACASGMWAQELDARRDSLTSQLTRAVPDVVVSGLRFVVGDHVIPTPEAARPRPAVTPTAAERAEAERLIGAIPDPELRERLVRAAAGQMAVARIASKKPAKREKPGRDARGG
jgi:hypothetical protein